MAAQPPQIHIAEPSIKSLLVQTRFSGQPLSTATAFVANSPAGPVLITNRHVVTGRNQETGLPLSPTGGIPDEIVIVHNSVLRLGHWVQMVEPLYRDGNPLWREHPVLDTNADFVALPLTMLQGVQLFPYTLGVGDPQILVAPGEVLSVVGFPFGLTVGGSLAVWATGFIASEPDVDFNNLPVFLIDCRSRQGQSGSAVIAHRTGGAVGTAQGVMVGAGVMTRFLGIYSGRVNPESDLGFVWKAAAVLELVRGMV